MADVINVDFVEDSRSEIPKMPEELENQARDTVDLVLSTIWTAGYLYGYQDGYDEKKD